MKKTIPKKIPFPTLDEFKAGIERAAIKVEQTKVFAKLEKEKEELLADFDDNL